MKKILIFTISIVIIIGFASYSDWEHVETDKNIGNWKVMTQTDPLIDEVEVRLILPCNEIIEDPNTSQPLLLILRATTEHTRIFVLGGFELSNKNIAYRFDDGEVEKSEWLMASNSKGLFFPKNEEDMENFLKRLIKAQEFIVGVYPKGQERSTFVFDTEGLNNALSPYLEEFGWENLRGTIEEGTEEEGY